MTIRDHTMSELITDPWINILAVLLGLALFFSICATKVSGDVPASVSTEKQVKVSSQVVIPHTSSVKSKYAQTIWKGDFSDISNERAGKAPAKPKPSKAMAPAAKPMPPAMLSP